MNLIRGRHYEALEARQFLDGLGDVLTATLKSGPLRVQTVIQAADAVSQRIRHENIVFLLSAAGFSEKSAIRLANQASLSLSRGSIEQKLSRELGINPFEYESVDERIFEKFRPLGVLTHIAAGNAAGLPAFSVLEGLLAGNINILKLPGNDDGLSSALLTMLIDEQPALADYIYIFDLPSADTDAIHKMLSVSDAVAVWGSDFAVSGIRALAPPNVRIIEWGHKISFAYVTADGESPQALEGIARDICESEQLTCSAPQCIYYEADSFQTLLSFADRFFRTFEKISADYPQKPLEPDIQAEVTSWLHLASIETLLENKRVYTGSGVGAVAEDNPALKASPLFRNVWIKPMRRDGIIDTLRVLKGYLQTVGLSCAANEMPALCDALYACGVCRIVPCGSMESNYAGEPHDGFHALRSYVRRVIFNGTTPG